MNKKGFTLIELLAVIVILAIIALIATPIVLSIINDSKESAQIRSAEMYLKGVETSVASAIIHEKNVKDGTHPITPTGDICLGTLQGTGKTATCNGEVLEVEMNGEKPESGSITIASGKIIDLAFTYSNGKTIVKNFEGKLIYKDSEKNKTLSEAIIDSYGEKDKITEIDATKREHKVMASGHTSVYSYDDNYYGTDYIYNQNNNTYTLSGNIVEATLDECRNGVVVCGKYISYTDEETYEVEEVKDWNSSRGEEYLITNRIEYLNEFGGVLPKEKFGLYKTQDDLGDSYYFRGAVINNYVQFGSYEAGSVVNGVKYEKQTPIYWRIVRINGDGTIRLIYDGTEKVKNGNSRVVSIADTKYNDIAWDNYDSKYAGYTYDSGNGNQVSSTIKNIVDSWYDTHLENKYGKYIADSIFCNDKSLEAEDRLLNPSVKCKNKLDRYTVDDTTNGNGFLSNPVGVITSDEVIFAGANIHTTNFDYYLYDGTGKKYWTMTLHYGQEEEMTEMFFVDDEDYRNTDAYGAGDYRGNLGKMMGELWEVFDVRPVINLKADVKFTGTGKIDDPYVIVTK